MTQQPASVSLRSHIFSSSNDCCQTISYIVFIPGGLCVCNEMPDVGNILACFFELNENCRKRVCCLINQNDLALNIYIIGIYAAYLLLSAAFIMFLNDGNQDIKCTLCYKFCLFTHYIPFPSLNCEFNGLVLDNFNKSQCLSSISLMICTWLLWKMEILNTSKMSFQQLVWIKLSCLCLCLPNVVVKLHPSECLLLVET